MNLNRRDLLAFLPEVVLCGTIVLLLLLRLVRVLDRYHLGGAALLLSLLEHLDTQVSQAILVAGYSTPPNASDEPVLQDSYDWGLIKSHVRELYFVNSWVDPYGCDAAQGRIMLDHLGGTQIIRNEGHFGDWNQDYPTFELLDRLIVEFPSSPST